MFQWLGDPVNIIIFERKGKNVDSGWEERIFLWKSLWNLPNDNIKTLVLLKSSNKIELISTSSDISTIIFVLWIFGLCQNLIYQ